MRTLRTRSLVPEISSSLHFWCSKEYSFLVSLEKYLFKDELLEIYIRYLKNYRLLKVTQCSQYAQEVKCLVLEERFVQNYSMRFIIFSLL